MSTLRGAKVLEPEDRRRRARAGSASTCSPSRARSSRAMIEVKIPAEMAGREVEIELAPGYEVERPLATPDSVDELMANLPNASLRSGEHGGHLPPARVGAAYKREDRLPPPRRAWSTRSAPPRSRTRPRSSPRRCTPRSPSSASSSATTRSGFRSARSSSDMRTPTNPRRTPRPRTLHDPHDEHLCSSPCAAPSPRSPPSPPPRSFPAHADAVGTRTFQLDQRSRTSRAATSPA